jgi:protoheme IX farnesyltransferase
VLRDYYNLTKPGIIYGNLLTALAGYFLVASASIVWTKLVISLLGFSLIVAAACVTNNIIDRELDKHMKRTRERALVRGSVGPLPAIGYACLLGMLGCLLTIRTAGTLALTLEVSGYVLYVAVYGIAKRRTVYGTLIGGLSGAVPPLAGYAARHHSLSGSAWLLFVLLVAWQIPHFFGIALFRSDDYAAASIPVWPVQRGTVATKRQALIYLIIYGVAGVAVSWTAHLGWLISTLLLLVNLGWIGFALRWWHLSPKIWGRHIFFYSLVAISVLSICIIIHGVFIS